MQNRNVSGQLVQSLNSTFFPPHIGAEPGRAKRESRITCMRMLRTPPFLPHSRHQRPRSFWSAPRIETSGKVQRHSGFEWICKHNRLRPKPIRFVRLDPKHAQSDGKSVNRGGRYSWCWPKGARPLETRMFLPPNRGKTIFGSTFQIRLVARFSE